MARPAPRPLFSLLFGTCVFWWCGEAAFATAADGCFLRLKLIEPAGTKYYVRLYGHIHRDPWYLPAAVLPAEADKTPTRRVAAGVATEWFDLKTHAGRKLHGRMSRSGGVAELPCVTADFITDSPSDTRHVIIELATAPEEKAIVKRWEERYHGSLTGFLASPHLQADKDQLELSSEGTARRLRWAREATGGVAHTPQQLIVQTQFWSGQRPELNLQEAEIVRLLGFNLVGSQAPEVLAKKYYLPPGHTHDAPFQPAATKDMAFKAITGKAYTKPNKKTGTREKRSLPDGSVFNFSDEITTRKIGNDPQGLKFFVEWLGKNNISPASLGVSRLEEVVPIETPDVLRERQKTNLAAANRIFYYTSRFRQEATSERLGWMTEAVHEQFGPQVRSSTLVADHPYFGNTGLGMGMGPDPAWHATALAADWFDLARRQAVDIVGVEDWMGLQYMYGPSFTFEGFQLMGFQSAMVRSGGRGNTPCIVWITPSDETNLRLKFGSALAQGAKHLFFWCYGPTVTGTENYWSDIRSAYDGMAHVSKQLAQSEHIIAPGKTRPTKVALLYSISSDLWQPFGYVHMLERRATYFSLVHQQYLVDMLTEEDLLAGRLRDYDVLYVTDPCIHSGATTKILNWVRSGGALYGSTAAGSRNEFNEEVPGLASAFGIQPQPKTEIQPGSYYRRGALNDFDYLDQIVGHTPGNKPLKLGVLGVKVSPVARGGKVQAYFTDGKPAVLDHFLGQGRSVYYACCPGLAYLKEAKFVPAKLAEKWPAALRDVINETAHRRGARPVVELSHSIVEAGVYDAPTGTALVLANFTYEPISSLRVRLEVPRGVKQVKSIERGVIPFESAGKTVSFTVPLGISDVLLLE